MITAGSAWRPKWTRRFPEDEWFECWNGSASCEDYPKFWSRTMGPSSRARKGIDLLPLAKMVVDMGAATVRKNLMQSYADFTGGVAYTHWKKHTLEQELQRIA